MKAEREKFIESLKGLTPDELLEITVSEHEARVNSETRESTREKIDMEIYAQYAKLKEDYDALLEEHKLLKEAYCKELEKNALKNKAIFGRRTEKLLSLIDEANEKPTEFEDENQTEENTEREEAKGRIISFPQKGNSGKDKGEKGGKKKTSRKSKLKESLEKLPAEIIFQINFALLNSLIGNDIWQIVSWREHISLERLPVTYYVKRILTPIITIGPKHQIYTMPYANLLIHHSYSSASIIADILYRKFLLGLPFYRQAMDYLSSGVALSRQTIIHWVNEIVPEYLVHVRDYLLLCLVRYGYLQIDESKLQVNKGSQGGVHNGFMWVHSSSELMDCNPIIVFVYEETRGTDHLRKLFSEFLGYIVCDAYISYEVFAKEHPGVIIIAGCLMHCRRYFAEAFFINDVASMSNDELASLHETKALLLIREIYIEENKLKDLSADERLKKRKELVKPKVDAFFEYVHMLEKSGEHFSDRMEKAIHYAINQEQKLREFLNDGNVPCDNGQAERKIRAYSVGRANWLFADTMVGAEVTAIMYSLVETAKANHVDVRIYLQYLLERIFEQSEIGSINDPAFLEELMPWSESYKQYEANLRSQTMKTFRDLFPEPVQPPRSGKGKIENSTPQSHGGNSPPPNDDVA